VYFSNKSEVAAKVLRYGAQVTGHTDIAEDLVWFLCGIVVGAGVACYAWWRDSKAQAAGLEKEDVLNRLIASQKHGKPDPLEKSRRDGG